MSKHDAAKCPHCGEVVEIDFYNDISDEVLCNSCDAELEIISKDPLKFRIVKRPDVYDEYRDIVDHNGDEFSDY
jgi:lysine biosynthesis protein LysW